MNTPAPGAASECPFCGQPPRTSPYRKDMVRCNNFACILFDASDEPNWYSVREWNTRTPAPVQVKPVDGGSASDSTKESSREAVAPPTDASGGVTADMVVAAVRAYEANSGEISTLCDMRVALASSKSEDRVKPVAAEGGEDEH